MPHAIRIQQTGATGVNDAADARKAWEARATSGSAILAIQPGIHRSSP